MFSYLAGELFIPEEVIGQVELGPVDGGEDHLGLVQLYLLGQAKVSDLRK